MSLASDPSTDAPPSGDEVAPSPAVAPPPGNPRFALFDSLRGLAVLAVLVFHVASVTGAINGSTSGNVIAVLDNEALIVFFAISGFLLYRPFARAHARGRPRPSTARYARRRALRILPCYWVALTLLAIYPGITGVFSSDWWRYYFFLQGYSSPTVGQGIPAAWSLCAEVTFYFSLPLWAIAIRWLRRVLGRGWLISELIPLAAVGLFGVVVQVAASRLKVSSLLTTTLPGTSVWFALGMALAVASVAFDRDAGSPPGWITAAARFVTTQPLICWVLAAACLAGSTIVLHPGALFNIIVSLETPQPYARTLGGIALNGAACVLLLAPAVFGERAGGIPRRVLAWAPLAWIGLVSYGMYVYQLAIVELLGEKSDPAHISATGLGLASSIHHLTTVVLLILSLVGSAVAAAISYYVVELPFLRRKEGRASR